ncbi:uncharacterized protein LOC107809772 [Nicotiana tabacum]|uniref:Uncharacterized protein LOC107809772 n=2 Tax=Nicotiana TaxID=4085 RepID=A0A1S4BM33_TOBAC|nr:PREDICTED: uncharacterized protein LOC104236858 [Nicotiana sylvestris]XP_016489948.1 PREDICTED: uncharacterized protein LOC107809772 [Nicotiana tabacum]
MAHNTTHRRTLTTSDHKPKTSIFISMDPTLKRRPKPNPFTSKTCPPHPHYCVPSNTIDNISNQFSQLYANHKVLKSSLKHPSGHSYSSDDNHLKVKSWTDSAAFDSSCTALTKSKNQHGSSKERKSVNECYNKDRDIDKKIVVQKKEAIKKVSFHKGKEFHKELDVKRALINLSRSQESERLKGVDEIKNQYLLRRKSFCSSRIELADFFSCNGVKVVSVDMPPFMQIHVVNCARKTHDSLEKFTSKALALTLKKEFDGVYGPAWHCIVGTSFGSFVTHSVGGFIYFSMDHKLYVLLFKTSVQKAESS